MTTPEPHSSTVEPTYAGVPLLQFAAVVAGQAEGFLLAHILTLEGLDAATWRRAELGFRPLLARGGEALARYQARLVEAQDRLSRRAPPLDEEIDAWASFLALAGRQRDVTALLREHALVPNDLARLGRLWERRLAEDPALAERAVERAAQAERSEPTLPALRLQEPRLVASPAARQVSGSVDRAPAPAACAPPDGPALDLVAFARLAGELRARPTARREAFARHGLSLESGEALERVWRERLRGDPALHADFRALSAHHERSIGAASELAAHPSPSGAAVPSRALEGVAELAAASPRASIDETQALDLQAIWGASDALPFERARGGHPTYEPVPVALTVEQYASLCALCAEYPEPHAVTATEGRFGVPHGARDALDRHWQQRFEAEPAVRAAWRARLVEYRAWLVSERHRGRV